MASSYTIVGVMPQEFQFPVQNDPVELWTTVAVDREGKEPVTEQRGAHYLQVIGRLKPGVSREQAQAEMTTIGARLEQQYPDDNLHHGSTRRTHARSFGRRHSSGLADSAGRRWLRAC